MTSEHLEQFGELLSAYVDGELDEHEAQRAATLLRRDPQARQLYGELKRTRELVHSLPRHSAPTSIAADVLARLERSALLPEPDVRSPSRAKGRGWWRAPLSIAAVLAAALTGWWSLSLLPRGTGEASRELVSAEKKELAASGAKSVLDSATVEEKLASGVALVVLQSHPFANEPVRLQLVVDSAIEQADVVRRVSDRLAAANVPDLSRTVVADDKSGLGPDATFFYRGQQNANFVGTNSEQLLVRGTPDQVEIVRKEIDRVARRDDQLLFQVGPLNMQGRSGTQAIQLFAEAASQHPVPGESGARARSVPGPAAAEERAPSDGAAKFVQELLKTAGIDSDKLASADTAARVDGDRHNRTSRPEASAPGGPARSAELDARASRSPSGERPSLLGRTGQNYLTFVVEIVTQPATAAPANAADTVIRAPRPPQNDTNEASDRRNRSF